MGNISRKRKKHESDIEKQDLSQTKKTYTNDSMTDAKNISDMDIDDAKNEKTTDIIMKDVIEDNLFNNLSFEIDEEDYGILQIFRKVYLNMLYINTNINLIYNNEIFLGN